MSFLFAFYGTFSSSVCVSLDVRGATLAVTSQRTSLLTSDQRKQPLQLKTAAGLFLFSYESTWFI